ncbi:hypothetical protein TSUD_368380 [Trifolium subterraneum]|uniref:Protein kinase domain-containing protein n=1 Tax=Trifolium subterraneum TaxID=3900 RepID=A0A2Z6MFR1_TRISU|nr:hypothetical protein TSUD_368380 [Trifolium subterraneum]
MVPIEINKTNDNFYDFSQGFYHKFGEDTNMYIDNVWSLQTSSDGGSVAMAIDNSSVGSNDSHMCLLDHQGLKRHANDNYSVAHNANHRGRVTHALSNDALAQALMDNNSPIKEWKIDLRKLYMGESFAQGALGKLYRGTYDRGNVAIKFLERHENNVLSIKEEKIDLRRLNMGEAFAQRAFRKLYRGTYDGEDVAIKLLERSKNNIINGSVDGTTISTGGHDAGYTEPSQNSSFHRCMV